MRVLVLVLAARVPPYPMLTRVIRRTWAATEIASVATLFYRAGRVKREHAGLLELPVADDLANTGRKTIACFEHVLEHHRFDLIFRTNCSSYVDLENLRSYVSQHARPERFYAGSTAVHEGVLFASGSGYFLSRDLVELVVRQRESWNHAELDDAALGALLARSGIEPEPTPRRDYGSRGDVQEVDTSQFHFRCRTDSWRRLGDARIMIALDRAFREARGQPVAFELRAVTALEGLVRRARSLQGAVRRG